MLKIFQKNVLDLNKRVYWFKKNFKIKKNQYMVLSKFSLSLMNSAMCVTGYLLNDNNYFFSSDTFFLGIGSLLLAFSSQSMGQILEKKEDSLMKRTSKRPLVTDSKFLKEAYIFTGFNYFTSNLILYNYFNINTVILGNLIFLGYSFAYIPLKKKNEINTFVGAIVGALPVLLGSVANNNNLIDHVSDLYLFFFMITWQIPHFYGILFCYKEDYKNAGFKMINDVDKACKHMYFSLFLMGIIFFCLLKNDKIDFSFFLILTYIMKYNYKYINIFKSNATFKNSKNIKISFYFTIMMLLIGLIIKSTNKKLKRKKLKNDKEN